MSKRKFFLTTFTVKILSEDEPISDELSLEEIERGFISGDWSGQVTSEYEELSAQETAYELMEQGSDPSFFNLTEDGEELNDKSDEDEDEDDLNEEDEDER